LKKLSKPQIKAQIEILEHFINRYDKKSEYSRSQSNSAWSRANPSGYTFQTGTMIDDAAKEHIRYDSESSTLSKVRSEMEDKIEELKALLK